MQKSIIQEEGRKWLAEFQEDPTIIQKFGCNTLGQRVATARICMRNIEEPAIKGRFAVFSYQLQKQVRFLIQEGYEADSDQPYQGSRRYRPNAFYRFIKYIFGSCLNSSQTPVRREDPVGKMLLQHPAFKSNLPKHPADMRNERNKPRPQDQYRLYHWYQEEKID